MPCSASTLSRVVWLNGDFVDAASARVPLLDRGYQLGEGVFATLHAYRGRCFRADRHLAQLAAGAEALGLPPPISHLETRLDEVAERVAAVEARVRVTITDTTTSILAEPLVPPLPEHYAHGIAAVIVAARRTPPMCFDGSIKSTSYAPSLVARRQARNADEGIQLAVDGGVACATMANLFIVRGDELATPALDSGCRAGVTRETVLDLAHAHALRSIERRIEPAELFAADEVFLTNTRIECLPIATVDGRPLRQASYAATLRAALRART